MHTLTLRIASHHHFTPWLTWAMGIGITLLLVALLWGVSMAATWAYPSNRLTPLSSIAGVPVRSDSKAQALATLEKAQPMQRVVVLYVGPDTYKTTLAAAGIEADAKKSVDTAFKKQQEMSGGSRAWEFWSKRDVPLVVRLDKDKFDEFYETELEEYHSPPADAQLLIENGQARIYPGEVAWRIDKSALKNKLLATAANGSEDVSVSVSRQSPEISAEQLQPELTAAKRLLRQQLTLKYSNKTKEVPQEEIHNWVIVSQKEKLPEASLDKERIGKYIKKLAGNINEDPVPVRRIIKDGEVISREEGEKGRKVKIESSVEGIVRAMEEGDVIAKLHLKTLQPGYEDSRRYSASSKGVNVLLSDFASRYGAIYGLSVMTLDGKIKASYDSNRQFVTASTYKIYLAYAVYREIESGNLKMSDATDAGSVSFCMKKMIIYSTNPCAIALGDKVGWGRIDKILSNAGFNHTKLNNHDSGRSDKYTTAADTTRFFQQLYQGELVNDKHKQQLLSRLQQQIYRDGIPVGVPNKTVSNKVGFLSGYIHDAGIIYSGKGDYILTIYSYGGGWWQFADLSRRLDDVMESR